MAILQRSFYQNDAITVAKNLLGKHLVHVVDGVRRTGKIVEVEAYLGPHDLAAHSSKGLTARTEVMFGEAGHAYIYLIYGIHHCFNVVVGNGAAILVRALEPISNIDDKTNGPGLLCRALAIDKRQNRHDLTQPPLFIDDPLNIEMSVDAETSSDVSAGAAKNFVIAKRPRVGVDYAGHWAKRLLRFYIKGNPWVSRP